MEYPKIIRDTIDFTSDTEVCNIGYNEGVLTDDRPYRIEVWSSHGVVNATIFMSIIGFTEKEEEDIKKYIVDNNLIEILEDDIYITEVEDINDNTFLSINIPLNEGDNIINKCLISLKDFEY